MAVVESFFQLLKRECIKQKTYATQDRARADVFDSIDLFYNTRRRHGYNGGLSPVTFERQNSRWTEGVWGIRGDSTGNSQYPS